MPCTPSKGQTIQGVYSWGPTTAVSPPTSTVALRVDSSNVTVKGHFILCPSLPAGPVSDEETLSPLLRTWYCWPPICASAGRERVE